MTMSSASSLLLSPVSGLTAALLIVAIFASQRAEAMSPVNPGMSSEVGKAVANEKAANELTIEVRGGHGGGGGGGGGGRGGGWGGGRGAGGVSGAVIRGGAIGAAPAVVAGAPRFVGHGFGHRRHFGGVFVGGVYYDDYPYGYPDTYDDPPIYPAPAFVAGGGCRRVLTVHGARVICHHRAARHYRGHRRHHHRRHHSAKR
jgi:hypothetical protein